MKQVNYSEYQKDLNEFIKRHSKKSDLHVWTSALVDGEYHKEYLFEDGNGFYKINNMNYIEKVEIEVHGLIVIAEVKMVKHEYYSTDDSVSKYWYEKF